MATKRLEKVLLALNSSTEYTLEVFVFPFFATKINNRHNNNVKCAQQHGI